MNRMSITALAMALAPCLAMAQDDGRPPLVVGVQDVRTGLNPSIELANTGFPISNALFDTLIRRDYLSNDTATGSEFRPGLAESWERIDDLTLEIRLRAGLTFHNGEPLTSEDVQFSLERILDPESPYVSARRQIAAIERVEAVDPLTVRIITRHPDPVLVHMLAFMATAIVPKDYYEAVGFDGFSQAPVGAGPYRLTDFRPDEAVELAAFDDYWGGHPPASTVTFREIPEVSARITALSNGEVDIIGSVPPDQIAAVERLDCCEVRRALLNSHVLNYNTDNPVMADVRFRQALNLAIDRDLLADALWGGEATLLNGHQYAEWGALYNPDRQPFAYDPEQARRLIAESGYTGEQVVFVTHPVYYTNGLAAAEAVVEFWRDVGVDARVQVREDWFGYSNENPDIQVRNLSDWRIISDPHATILWSWTITALWEDNGDFQALGEQAGSTLDTAERHALYQQMLDMMEAEAPGTVLYRIREFFGVRSDIGWIPYAYMYDFRPYNLSFRNPS